MYFSFCGHRADDGSKCIAVILTAFFGELVQVKSGIFYTFAPKLATNCRSCEKIIKLPVRNCDNIYAQLTLHKWGILCYNL